MKFFTSVFLLSLVAGSLAAPQPRGKKAAKAPAAAPAPAAAAMPSTAAAATTQDNASTGSSSGSTDPIGTDFLPQPANPLQPAAVTNPGEAGPATVMIQQSLTDAAANWAKNTAVVSNFLNQAPFLKGQAFVQQAQIALNAEINELVHKATLDANSQLTSSPAIMAANNSLVTQQAFQKVVDALRIMAQTGDSIGLQYADAINTNRCKNVLPSIDAYLKAAGTNFLSTRPFNCGPSSVQALGPAPLHDQGGTAAPGGSSTGAPPSPLSGVTAADNNAPIPPPPGGSASSTTSTTATTAGN